MSMIWGFPAPNSRAHASRNAVAVIDLPVPAPPRKLVEMGRKPLSDGGIVIEDATCAISASMAFSCPWQVLVSSSFICLSDFILFARSFAHDFLNSMSATSCARAMTSSTNAALSGTIPFSCRSSSTGPRGLISMAAARCGRPSSITGPMAFATSSIRPPCRDRMRLTCDESKTSPVRSFDSNERFSGRMRRLTPRMSRRTFPSMSRNAARRCLRRRTLSSVPDAYSVAMERIFEYASEYNGCTSHMVSPFCPLDFKCPADCCALCVLYFPIWFA